MPAKEPLSDHPSTCHRNFVRDLMTGNRYAVFPRMFDFEHLDHVSERWLKEVCPSEYLNSDAETRKLTRIRPPNTAKHSEPEECD
jgi:hypothetical protein